MEKQQLIYTLNKQIKDGTLEATIDGEQIWDYAFLLTQYEKYGAVGKDELEELMIKEYFDDNEVGMLDWNEYCSENKYFGMMVDYLDEEYFRMMYYNDPFKAIQDVLNGDVNLSDKYIRCDDVWGLESMDDYTDLFDDEFRKWFIYEGDCHMEDIEHIKDNAEVIINTCNRLIRAGY